jgi:23S rRNA (pseudouridine1915-N3)-methyltransferase
MKILLATITPRRAALTGPAATLLESYITRSGRYSTVEHRVFPTEDALLGFLEQSAGRTRPALLLADSRGKQLSSEEFAAELARLRDSGTQVLLLGIGPADGWSAVALKRADLTLAFGRITLPHELAAVVAGEQIYRALTILAGHPYHTGH